MPIGEFIVGPKRNVLAGDELIAGFRTPRARGPQQFSKIGTRNAMVIAVCSFALDLRDGEVGTCIGSAAPTPVRAREAEAFAAGMSAWDDDAAVRFGELVAAAASPIDDVRGSAAYRRHATFYTDAYAPYRRVISQAQHRVITKATRQTNSVERFTGTLRQRTFWCTKPAGP